MEADNGRLNFVPRIDNSQIRQDAEETKDVLHGIGASAEEVGRYSDEALSRSTNSVYERSKSMSETIADMNEKAKQSVTESVDAAQQQMDRLKEAFQRGYNYEGPVSDLKKNIQTQIEYLKELENKYNQTKESISKLPPGKEWAELTKTLNKQKREIDEEKQALAGLKQKYDELSSNSLVSFRTKMRDITNQMAQMRLEGRHNTEEYKKLETELGKLATIQREVRNNMTSDSTGATQWTGIIQGVQGLMGVYSVGSGIVGMFTKDQEKLMKVQTKMQSVMGVLMGMQTIANTLHSTSTFRLRTLTKAQELYTLAVNKTKVALLSGSAAARTFKLALATTGVGLLVVGITALVSAISKMKEKAKESAKEMEAFKKSLDITYAGTGQVAKATTEINTYITALENANLTKVQEKKLIDELNAKYGGLMGTYKTKADWLDALKTKTEDYINTLRLQAQAEEATKQAMEAADKEEEAQKKVEEVKSKNQPRIDRNKENYDYYVNQGNNLLASGLARQNEKLQKEIDDANTELEEAVTKREEAFAKLGEVSAKLQEKQLAQPGATQSTAEAIQKQLDEIDKIRQNGLKSINANEIALMKEGKDKKLAEIEAERAAMLAALDKERQDLDKKLKEAGQGGLSKADKANYATREIQINARQDAKVADVEKENTEAIAKMYRELGDVFATEEQRKVNAIKRRYEEQRKQLQQQKEGGSITEELYIDLVANVDRAEAKETFDYWLAEYGTYDQKRKAIDDEWRDRLKNVPAEFAGEAERQMTEALSKLDFEQFKKTIDWSGVFGDLGKQSSEAIKYNLSQIRAYFEGNKLDMGVDEIKDLQQAIATMSDELERRNPLAGLINAMHDIGAAKAQAVEAVRDIAAANEELNAAIEERRLAEEEIAMYENETDAEGETDIAEAKAEAQDRLTKAIQGVAAAEAKKTEAERKGVTASNNMAASYRKLTSNLQSVKGVVSGLGNDVKNLAAVFSDEVADGVGKAVNLMETVIDSATNVIDVVADTGKKVSESITGTVQASSAAMTATSMAAATSIQTVEKASVILAVISAALQVATAIASLFDGDKAKDKQIESLQSRIDQLQWEIDNADILRLQADNQGKSALDMTYEAIGKTIREMAKAKQSFIDWKASWKTGTMVLNTEAVTKAADQLNKAYVKVGYSAGKVFGDDFWNQASANARKYAEEVVNLQQQLQQEQGKKKKDEDKIQDLENQIEETGAKINETYNKLIEDIIGGSYQDIADQLGDAFIEAFQNGEDAAEAWGEAVDKIVADVIKRMFIQQFLTQRISDVFAKYKDKWLDENGNTSYDKVMASMESFGNDLKKAGDDFSEEWQELMKNDYFKELFGGDATREAAQKGIQSISQDSADEMNGRLTAMQGHTYSINENTKLLVQINQNMLYAVLEIQDNTERIYRYMAVIEQELAETRTSLNVIGRSISRIA